LGIFPTKFYLLIRPTHSYLR